MPDHVSCPRCGCACRVQPHNSAHCVQCFTSFRTDTLDGSTPPPAVDREPQGETVRLFEPAPAQMPGQTSMPYDPTSIRDRYRTPQF